MRGFAPKALLLVAVLAAVLWGAWRFLGEGSWSVAPGRVEAADEHAPPQAPTPPGTPPAPLSPAVQREAFPSEALDASAVALEGDLPPGTGLFLGRVLTVSGQPVADAQVELTEGSLLIKSVPSLRAPVGAPARSDFAGHFVLHAPRASRRYFVVACSPGSRSTILGPLTLDPGETRTLPDLLLPPGIALEGTVSAAGRPVPRAAVKVTSFDDGLLGRIVVEDTPPEFTLETTTDRNGHYEFPSVPSLSLRVSAAAPGLARISRERASTDASEQMVIDLELRAAEEIRGLVQDPDGHPVQGARVRGSLARDVVRCQGEAQSDGEGHFLLAGLAGGSYDLTASAPGFVTGKAALVDTGSRDVVLTLASQGAVSGAVRAAGSGAVLRRYRLQLLRSRHGRETLPTPQLLDVDDAAGAFRLPDIDPGDYVLEARAAGYAPSRSDPFTVRGGITTRDVTIFMDAGCALHGRVVNERGKGIQEARVTLRSNGSTDDDFLAPPVERSEGSGAPTTTTTADGTFALEHQVPGMYQVHIEHPDFAPVLQNSVALEDAGSDLGEVLLLPGAALSGAALDSEGKPLPGATIQATSTGLGLFHAVTDASGAFSFPHLPPADYVVQIVDFQSWRTLKDLVRSARDSAAEVTLGEGTSRDVVLQLTQ